MQIAVQRQRRPAAEERRATDLVAHRAGPLVKPGADAGGGRCARAGRGFQSRAERLLRRAIHGVLVERSEIDRHGADIGIRKCCELLHHGRHRPGGDAVKTRLASSQVCVKLILTPWNRRLRQRRQRGRFPAFRKSAGEIGVRLLCAQRVPRRMAGTAMAEAFDQIGAAIPSLGLGRLGLENHRLVEQCIPSRQQRAQVERKREGVVRRLRTHRRLRHQISIERLHVGVGAPGEMRVGKRGIKMSAVAMNALAHRALEGGIGPRADAGFDIGGDVGRVDGAERRRQRAAAGVEDAVIRGVANRAVAERGELLAARDGRGRIDRCIGLRDWRDRAPWQHGSANADRRGAQGCGCREYVAASGKRIAPPVGVGLRRGYWRRQRFRCRLLLATQSPQNAFRRERQFAKAHTGRIKDGVGDGSRTRDGSGLADAERRLVLSRQHQHVDLGHFGKLDDGVGAPFARRHRRAVERHFFHQRAAGRLDDVAVDLVAHAVRIDHQAGILPGNDARHADVAGLLVDGDISDPGRPRRAVARKLTVDITRVGKAAPAHDVAFGDRLFPDRARAPAGTLGDGLHQIDRARIFEIAQAILDRVDAGFGSQFVDIGFVRERIGQRRDATKPRCAHDRRHVMRDHAHVFVIVRRDRGAVAHLEHIRRRRNRSGKQQRQGRGAVGGIACRKIISSDAAVGAQSALDVHQLGGALWLPGVLLLARQLHADRTAGRARQQNRVGRNIVGAVAAVAAGGLHPDHVDVCLRTPQQ